MSRMHVLIDHVTAAIWLNGNCLHFDPHGSLVLLPHLPADAEYRTLDGAHEGVLPFTFAWTFFESELDLQAIQTWWDNHHSGADPDIFKNNSLGKPSRTGYSVVARLLKQGGAEELWHVNSPSLLNWEEGDLIRYVKNLREAIARGTNVSNPQQQVRIANANAPKK
jgi:hypothetical protein